ncbi:MAG: hypothetical protein ACYSTF_09030 [Planctomycetota bacterium]|jgi:hypothetical protein
MTKSNKSQQNTEKAKLTVRQLKAIPIIVANPTYSEGCKKARLNRTTFYEWMKIPELVEALVSLLDNKDDRLRRLTAKDVIDFIIRHKENEDLDERLTAIEKRLAEKSL